MVFLILGPALLGAGALYVLRATPVVFEFVEPGDPTGEPSFSLFNPFRDRKAEAVADRLLSALEAGNTHLALAQTPFQETPVWMAAAVHNPPSRWTLRGRKDLTAGVNKLYYSAQRSGGLALISITLVLENGAWRVHAYETAY